MLLLLLLLLLVPFILASLHSSLCLSPLWLWIHASLLLGLV
jgi:hypothetical protein